MERHEILDMMGTLKLAGLRHAYDEVVADAVKRQHSAQRVVGDLPTAEIDEKQALDPLPDDDRQAAARQGGQCCTPIGGKIPRRLTCRGAERRRRPDEGTGA